jgi:hypothetical protein
MNGINKYIKQGYFNSKTLLELGCGHAHLGNKFSELGAIVTSSDGRQEHLDVVNELYPHLKTLRIDLNKDDIPDTYDIILFWGLLYHLEEIETPIEKVSNKCNVLLLETEISDSDDDTFFISPDENGYDQAISGKGIRPSPAYVEKVLEKNGFQFKLIKDKILNNGYHQYDKELTNRKIWYAGFRRFWICWKNVESPLID